MVTQMAEKTKITRNRYPGSIPFDKDDKWVFFGRDDDIENLKTKIYVERTIVLHGKSGLGKTSLLNAGVLPQLERQYIILPLRFGAHTLGDLKHPLDILDQKLLKYCHHDSFLNEIEPEDISFWQNIKNLQLADLDHPILLVFDQFEELFTYSQGVDRFAEALAEVLYNRMPRNFQRALHLAESTKSIRLSNRDIELLERSIDVKLLMAIRSDRMSLLDRLSRHIPNILKNCYELKHLSRAQAQTAISAPARKEGEFKSELFSFQPESLEKMLAYLTQNGQKPVESSQLQILCQYVEKNIVDDEKNKVVKPVDLGNLASIYHDFYDRTIKNIGNQQEQYKARLLIEDGLIFEEEERRIRLFEGQIENTYDISKELLRKIVDTHIVRREPRGDGYMYELSHDSLVAPILRAKDQRRRREEKRKEEEKRRREEEDMRKAQEEELILIRAHEKAAYEARSAKKMRLFSIVLGVLVLIILGAFIKIYLLSEDQEDRLFVSDAKALVENANKQIKQSSLLLVRQAYGINTRAKGSISSMVYNGLREFLDRDFLIQELSHDGIVGPVAFSPDGKTLATGSSERGDNIIYLWNLDNLDAEPSPLGGHQGEIHSLVFSPTGKFLASAGEDETVRLWEFDLQKPETRTELPKVFTVNTGKVWSVAFSPDESSLAAAGEDMIVRLWDLKNTGAKPIELIGHTEPVMSVVFSPEGKILASGGKDTEIRLWDLENPEKIPVILQGHEDGILSVAFDADGKRLASGGYDKTVRLWNIDDPSIASTVYSGHREAVRSVTFSPDGKTLASGSFDHTVRLWDLDNRGADPLVLTGHKDYIFSVAFSPDGKVLASGSEDRTARLWYLKQTSTFTYLRGHKDRISSVALSQNGKILASGSHDKTVHLWDVKDLDAEPSVLRGNESDIWSVAFSPDDQWLAAGSKDKTVRLWDMENQSADPIILDDHNARVWSVAFSPDNWLASGSSDMTVCLWDFTKQNLRASRKTKMNPIVLQADLGKVYAVTFSPDNRWLAAGSDDMIVRLWDRKNLDKKPIVLRGHEGIVLAVTFSPDSKTLASGSVDKTVRLWNVKNPIEDPVVLKGHESWIRSLVFNRDGNTLVTGSGDKTVRCWNLKNPNEDPIVLNEHSRGVHGVAVSPDGEKIFSGSEDTTIIQWIASPAILADEICDIVGRNLSVDEWKISVGRVRDYDMTCRKFPIHPSFMDYIVGLAISGDIEGASTHLQKAKKLDPHFELDIHKELVLSLRGQGQRRAERGDVDGAIISFDKAKMLDPDLDLNPRQEAEKLAAEGLIKKGKISARDGDLEGAHALFKRAAELNPDLDSNIAEAIKQAATDLVRKGENSARQGEIEGAVVLLEQAKELNPALDYNSEEEAKRYFVSGQVRKGEYLARDGKLDEAVESFEKAKEVNPVLDLNPRQKAEMLFAAAQVRKGEILAKDGKLDEAKASFKKAKRLNPKLDLDPEQKTKMYLNKARVR